MKQPSSPAVLHLVKTTLIILAALFGAVTLASAQTNATLYQEDWGTAYYAAGNPAANPAITAYGWTNVGGQYSGTFSASTASFDITTGVVLSNHSAYYASQVDSDAGIMYTTDTSGSGTNGDSTFSSITPVAGLTLNVESQVSAAAGSVTNFFAVMVGGTWYVSVNPMTNNPLAGGPIWGLNSLLYNPAKANWNILTQIASAPITVGGNPSSDLSGTIDGVGIVQTWSVNAGPSPGFNYLNYTITAPIIPTATPVITGTGASSTNYIGGTASFAVSAVSTSTLTYSWSLNGGAPLVNGPTGNGSTIFGATSNIITISNLSSADAGTYTATVNGTDAATNSLTLLTPGPELLYAETFPFVGPTPYAQSPTNVGWRATIPATDVPNRLDNRGELYAYENAARTMGFFTATNFDTAGVSGLPFPANGINPANSPFVSFRATYAALQNSGNAAVFFAVQMAGGQWFVSTSANQLGGTPANYNEYGLEFSPTASGWNKLTVSLTGNATVGTAATANLTGNITGVGLVFVFTGPSCYLLNNVAIVTNSTPPVSPSFPSEPNVPYDQTVYAGGGASFSFTEAGTLPFTNTWHFGSEGGPLLTDGTTSTGSIISGSTTTEITVQNVSSADAGAYSAVVLNPGGTGSTDSGAFGSPILTVQSPPLGLIYNETFPLYVVPNGNQPLSIIGWTNQSDSPNRIFLIGNGTTGTGAAFAYEGNTTNSLFYASTESDTGASGLPFIAFDPANYPAGSLQFSASFASGNAASIYVSASIAVRIGGNWYVNVTPIVPTNTGLNGTYTLYSQTVNFAASQWKTVTLVGTQGVVVGGLAPHNLTGPITAAGLLFQHFFTVTVPANFGGSVNFDSFAIQAMGNTGDNLIGGVNISAGANGTAVLTWVGNPEVQLQSSPSLTAPNWQDVPNTLGNHTLTVTPGALPKYFRLAGLSAP